MHKRFSKIPTTQSLLAFEAVARHHRFKKAAEELCISDSAVSHRIRELERLLGFQLFVRSTRAMHLTPDGAVFLEHVQNVLERLEISTERFFDRPVKVRLSILPSFARFWLIPNIKLFLAENPKITLDIDTTVRRANLVRDEADLAVRFGKPPKNEENVLELMGDTWSPVATPQYARQLGSGSLAERLSRANLIEHKRQSWQPWLDKAEISLKTGTQGLIFSDTALMIDVAKCHSGVALARRSLVHHLVKRGELIYLSDISLQSSFSYYLVSTSSALRRAHIKKAHDWIAQLAQHYNADAD